MCVRVCGCVCEREYMSQRECVYQLENVSQRERVCEYRVYSRSHGAL